MNLSKNYSNSILSSERGFSVVEGLIAAGLMSVVALSSVSVLYNVRKSSSGSNSVCMSYSQGVLSKFRSLGQFSQIYWPFYPDTISGHTFPVPGAPPFSLAGGSPGIDVADAVRWATYGGAEILVDAGGNMPPFLRNYRAINSSVNAVLSVYNTDPAGFCAGKDVSNIAGLGRPTAIIPFMPSELRADATLPTDANAPRITYTILPYNTVTGVILACPNPLAIIPPPNRGAGTVRADDTNAVTAFPYVNNDPGHTKTGAQRAVVQLDAGQLVGGVNNTEVGLLFRIRVDYKTRDKLGAFEDANCDSESRFQYEKSLAQPVAPLNFTISNSAVGMGTNTYQIQLGYSGVDRLKPGNVFVCRDRSFYPAGWMDANVIGVGAAQMGSLDGPSTAHTRSGALATHAGNTPAKVPCFASEADASSYRSTPNAALIRYKVVAFATNTAMNPKYFPQIGSLPKNVPTNATGLLYNGVAETDLNQSRWRPCDEVTACGVNPVGGSGALIGNQYIQLTYNNLPQYCRIRIEVAVVDPALNQNNNSNNGAGIAPIAGRQSAIPPGNESELLDSVVYNPITAISYIHDRDVNFALDPVAPQCGRYCMDTDSSAFPGGYYIPSADTCTFTP